MTTEVRPFSPSIPAGTPSTAPVTIPLTMPARIVSSVRARIPPGPRGTMGFALVVAGAHVVPFGDQAWIIADDETMQWDLTNVPQTGACLLYTSPSPRDYAASRMPSSA